MPTALQDLSQAIRGLRRRPGFTLAALVTLAVGIGANVTVFSIVNALLLRPLPFGDRSERVVTLHSTHRLQPEDWQESLLSYPDLLDVQHESRSFEGVAGYVTRSFTVTTESEAERLLGESITPNLFPLLGIEPMLGRNFLAEEAAAPGLETAVMLTHGLWQRRYGADPSIIGRSVIINERARTVVGVMPPGFKFPHRSELYMPYRALDNAPRSGRGVAAIGVLEPSVSIEQAQSEVSTLARRLAESYPASNREYGIRVLHFREAFVRADGRALSITLMAAVGFVLLIVCANLANLSLVRGASRQREMAVRAAMGAGRARLVWSLVSESAVLSFTGSILGAFGAMWMVDYMRSFSPEEMPYWFRQEVDSRLLVFTILIAGITTIATGLLPALRASRPNVAGDLKEGSRGASLGRSAQRLQGTLAVAQVALCLALLVGANLMIRSFLSLQRADLGFDDSPMLTMRVYLAGDSYNETQARAQFFGRAVDALATLPGVRSAVVTSSIPGDDGGNPARIVVDGRTAPGDDIPVQVIAATSDLFDTLGLKIRAGRTFTLEESIDPETRVTVLNERLASRLWPDGSAVGRRVGIPGGEPFDSARRDPASLAQGRQIEWYRVVGIGPNVHYEEAGEATDQSQMNLYVPYGLNAGRTGAILLRTEGDPRAFIAPAREALHQLHAGLPVFAMRTMEDVRRTTTWEQRFFGMMMGGFAVSALLLACLGVYALLAYAARRRTHEIGVRLALGANPRDVVTLFVWQASRIGIVGLLVGLMLAVAIARALRGILFEVDALDPWLFAGTGGALLLAVLAASYLPARRASRTDPMIALRVD